MKQNEAVIVTLERLGGIATLGQLNQEVFKIKECTWKTKTPFASIRRIVQQHKEIYKRFGISDSTVNVILRERKLKPHLVKKFQFMASSEAGFIKARSSSSQP